VGERAARHILLFLASEATDIGIAISDILLKYKSQPYSVYQMYNKEVYE
jgi:hypothetical protein